MIIVAWVPKRGRKHFATGDSGGSVDSDMPYHKCGHLYSGRSMDETVYT